MAPPPRLEAGLLEARALRGAAPAAFGPDHSWRAPFEILLRSLREEADLNPLGLTMAHGQIVMMLRARMRAHRLWVARPEILDRPVPAPIVILGQMRSGTTRLHRLLACDPGLAFTRMYESLIPVPFGRRDGLRDRRRRRARLGLAMLRWLNPEIARIHPTLPDDAEEEFGLLSFSFGPAQYEAQWRVPGFTRWWEVADKAWLYREFRALLQTAAWHRGEPADRPVILKAPQFLEDLPALLDVFPDARLVLLHRDLPDVVSSSASLVWNQMRVQSGDVDKEWIGREWLRKTLRRREAAERACRSRTRSEYFRLFYSAMNADWRREMARLYDFLGLDLTAEVLARMATWLDGARDHLGHVHSLEQFGLSATDIAGMTGESGRAKRTSS